MTAAPRWVSVRVNSSATGGRVFVAAYATPEAFAADNFVDSVIVGIGRRTAIESTLELPSAGQYVLAAFQDMNGNGELDTNIFGVPTEPYGFSRQPPSKWRTPTFGEIATTVGDGPRPSVDIELRYWREY